MKLPEKKKAVIGAAAEGVVTRQALMETALDDIIGMAGGLSRALKRGGTVYLAGNGGFDKIFARQVEGLAGKKDILMLISTSGNSSNLIEAAKAARAKGVAAYALLGCDGGKLKKYAEKKIIVPSDSVQRIQEEHTFLIHTLVHLVERDLFA
jgi:D-sedoheptulose 7-phosphate isomerase